MCKVGTMHFESPYLAGCGLHLHMGEVATSTAGARVVSVPPFPEAPFTEQVFTAVDHLGVLEDIHTDDTT